jgi:Uma2 family endonuclease
MNTPIVSIEQLSFDKIYSYDDYLTWQFTERIELLRGYIRQMAAPNRRHQRVSGRFYKHFADFLYKKSCEVYYAPFDVKLIKNPQGKTAKEIYTVVQPDICVICDPNKLDEQGCLGSPDLIIEIVSENNVKRDVQEKYELYEENGVLEYWIVRPYENSLQQFYLEQEKYVLKKTYLSPDTISPIILPNLSIDLSEVFEEGV